MKPGEVTRIDPAAAIPGAEILLEYGPVPRELARSLAFEINDQPTQIVAASSKRALVAVPPVEVGEAAVISTLFQKSKRIDSSVRLIVGKTMAAGLHPVANPAFDPRDGSLFVTRSGSRGEHVPVSVFRIATDGTVEDFSSDIMNPTSIAFDRLQRMFVTGRFDGAVYRVTSAREVVAFASNLGIATGLAFNRDGDIFVGDRTGTIYRVNEIGEVKPWAQHEPSVSAYHLAVGPDDHLYVTGPTVSTFDSITEFDQVGNAKSFYRGLGRPQGLAFDRDGNLYVAASLRGRRGIVRIGPNASKAELVVAAMNVVGLAFGPQGEMVVATNEAVYRLPLGIYGTLLQTSSL